jgi:hypothetical protein
MHEATVANGSEQSGERNVKAQNPSAQIAIGHCYGMTRPEGDLLKCVPIFAERDLGLRTTIQVIENCSR